MAYKNAYDYRLVDDEAGLEDAVPELKRNIEGKGPIAVDCEGLSLSRKGALTIITVATEDKAYIFDVLKLGKAVFSGGLGEILEDKSCEKLMFDCREDSDALWHQFRVKLTGVLDLQLLEIFHRRRSAAARSQSWTKHNPRSQRTDEVESIYGFRRCLELYVQDTEMIKMKEKGAQAFKHGDKETWKKRPLTTELLQYCVVDTMGMFKLYDKLKDAEGRDKARLQVASERYVDLYRGKTQRYFDQYETNALLPLYIIPDDGASGYVVANTPCTKCHRLFPREEFSKTQLRKGEQKCRNCKELKRRADAKQNREAQWGRSHTYDYDTYDTYDYFSGEDFDDYF
ncbi:piRNA biogenesis protein EXD1-like [Montipora foliosa]|uniref:piRNA biogenesis protein EXD1-like n=1 Tax=Montipora foliosa TaxID=591990 RepID=UPI0035F12D09